MKLYGDTISIFLRRQLLRYVGVSLLDPLRLPLKKPDLLLILEKERPPANPNEKNILWRILQLLRLNVQLVFVTDGPHRPKKRNLAIQYGNNDNETALLREMLGILGVPWHRAPAEAEAECAMLQKLGIVDAVWTEDSDALMFGATTVIRFSYKPAGDKPKKNSFQPKKNNLEVRVYQSEEIAKTHPCLDRQGMVLFAVLSGGDYNTVGLPNIGPEGAIEAAKHGFGHTLCRASENGTLEAWKEELQVHLVNTGSKVRVPAAFPDPGHVKCYNNPVVSSTQTLKNLEPQWWSMPFGGDDLWYLLLHRFNLGLSDFIQLVVPIFLVRSLAQTSPGQEASNGCYQILHVSQSDKIQSKVSFILSAVMTWDLFEMVATFAKDHKHPPERVVVEEILDCILRHGVPNVMKGVESQPIPGKKKGRPSKTSTDVTPAIPREPVKSGNKRGRKAKTTVQDSMIASENGQAKRTKLSTPDTRNFTSQDAPAPALKAKPAIKKSQVVDLTSDNEEEKALTPLSPNSQTRQARLRHF